jgi:hypothetical protein
MLKKIAKIFCILLLLVFLWSLDFTGLELPSFFKAWVNTQENRFYACLKSELPEHAEVLFFSQSDGTLDYSNYTQEYGSAQYELVPRVLVAYRREPVKMEDYTWLIAYNLPAEEFDTISKKHTFDIVVDCEQSAVLRRIP